MNKLLLTLCLIIYPATSYADSLQSVINKVYDKGSNKLEGFILEEFFDGPGDTEISINTKDEHKPEISIMMVRPINIQEDRLSFYQLQLSNHSVIGDARQTINIGYGHRFLSSDKTRFVGVNTFFDHDIEKNSRLSIGAELSYSGFQANGNYYKALSESHGAGNDVGGNQERVLDGYDFNLVGQVPNAPWASIVYTDYKWEAVKNEKDSQGRILKTELDLTNTVSLEAGYDKNNISKSMEFIKITYNYPGKDKPTMQDGIFEEAYQKSDVSDKMLTKVRRSNAITVEVEASGVVIARGNN